MDALFDCVSHVTWKVWSSKSDVKWSQDKGLTKTKTAVWTSYLFPLKHLTFVIVAFFYFRHRLGKTKWCNYFNNEESIQLSAKRWYLIISWPIFKSREEQPTFFHYAKVNEVKGLVAWPKKQLQTVTASVHFMVSHCLSSFNFECWE